MTYPSSTRRFHVGTPSSRWSPARSPCATWGRATGRSYRGCASTEARLTPGERIVFGKVSFELRQLAEFLIDDHTAEVRRRAARAGTTIIRQVPVPDADQALEQALMASGVQPAVDAPDSALVAIPARTGRS